MPSFAAFDSVIKRFDVYKVETIADSYMCISGLPNRNGIDHASQIASMSLELLFIVKTIPVPHTPEKQLQVRIGVHSGAVVAGVLRISMPRYCLFGDTGAYTVDLMCVSVLKASLFHDQLILQSTTP